jgi:hypothetical protein
MFYISTRKGVFFGEVSPLQEFDKVKDSYNTLLLVKVGSE